MKARKPLLSLALMVVVLALAWRSYPQQKDPGGCDIPRSWGRLAQVWQGERHPMLVFEAEDGTLRFVTWARCELRATSYRLPGNELRGR